MINITYSGWICIFCVIQITMGLFFIQGYLRLRAAIKNHKDQMMLENKALALLINKGDTHAISTRT